MGHDYLRWDGAGTVRPGVGQKDQGWDRGTRDGTEGPWVGQKDQRWDRRTKGGTGGL